MKVASIWKLTLSVGSCAIAAAQEEHSKSLTEDLVKMFRILDRFDGFDTSKLPFVKVSTGRWTQVVGGPKRNTFQYGFLTESQGRQFEVRYLHWGRDRFEMTGKNTPAHLRVRFEPKDLRSFSAEVLERIRRSAKARRQGARHLWDFYVTEESPMNPTALVIVLARECARRGYLRPAQDLWDALPHDHQMLRSIRSKLGSAMDLQITIEFSHRSSSWNDLLTKHRAWLESFPNHWSPDRIRAREATLAQMIKEEAKRKVKTTTPQDQAVRIEHLIYELRNDFLPVVDHGINGHVLAPVGAPATDAPTAAEELLKIGHPAAPALLDAIEDNSLTRTAYYSSRFGGRFGVRTVRIKAYHLLCKMLGRPLNLPPSRAMVMAWHEAQRGKTKR